MKKGLSGWLFALVLLSGCGDSSEPQVQSDSEKAVNAAYMLCKAMKNTGLSTECEVKGWGSTVDLRIDTNSSEARKICSGVVKQMSSVANNAFGGKWELQIFSPYSGEHPIATCTLY